MASAAQAFAPAQHFGAPKRFIVPVTAGEQIPELTASALAAAFAVALVGTSVSGASAPIVRLQDIIHVAPKPVQAIAVVEMLRAIRRRTALTWDQLGSIFAVSRRSLHNWANRQPVTAENQFKIRKLHDRVLALGDEPAFVARASILADYGIAPAVGMEKSAGSPILVADQTPIAARVSVSRSPRTRVR